MIAGALDLPADDIALNNFSEQYNCSKKADKFGTFMKFVKEKNNSTRHVKITLLTLVPNNWQIQESVLVSVVKKSKYQFSRTP